MSAEEIHNQHEDNLPAVCFEAYDRRNITVAEARDVLENGELIEEYKADSPPRYLLLGWSGNRPIHVVGEDDPVAGETTVVTAYEPDAKRWKAGFRERRR